jgi:hypothetical protein
MADSLRYLHWSTQLLKLFYVCDVVSQEAALLLGLIHNRMQSLK